MINTDLKFNYVNKLVSIVRLGLEMTIMSYMKDDLNNTTLPTLIIEKRKRYRVYPQIGFGDEASVHKYNEKIAFKTFDFIRDKEKLPKKFEKIELIGQLYDVAACFPIGLVGYEDKKKEGYYCDLVKPLKDYKDFDHLQYLKDMRQLLGYIIQADEAIQRFHKMGFILGDIKGNNIMIDHNGNVRFVDTDNWMYHDYGFDLYPSRADWLHDTFNKNFSLIDNDRFVFAMMVIQYFIDDDIVRLHHPGIYFKHLIELMDVSQEVKDGLRLIFSDANEKPYIGSILKKINPEQKIISKEAIYKIKYIF